MDEGLREWRGRAVAEWREIWGLPELRVFRTVGSTNDVARALADAGAPHGAAVLAGAQTRGRGRRGSRWRDHPGQSLLLSMVVRPGAGSEPVLALRLGLAAARAIESVSPLAVGVKWPNDLMVQGRKVGGMLCEGVAHGDRVEAVIAGVGINIAQPDEAWDAELAGRASSLAARAGSAPALDEVAGAVIAAWLAALDARGGTLTDAELEELRRRDVLAGRPVTVDGVPAGVAEGVAPDGALRVRDGEERRRVVAGTVRATDTGEESS